MLTQEMTMQQLRTNMRAYSSTSTTPRHLQLWRTVLTFWDVYIWTSRQRGCQVFISHVICKMLQQLAPSSGSGKINLLFTLMALGNFVPLTKGNVYQSSTITVVKKFPWNPKPPLHFRWMWEMILPSAVGSDFSKTAHPLVYETELVKHKVCLLLVESDSLPHKPQTQKIQLSHSL